MSHTTTPYLSGTQLSILLHGCEAVAVRGRYRWVLNGSPVGAEVSRLRKMGFAKLSEWGDGHAAVNATPEGRSVLDYYRAILAKVSA